MAMVCATATRRDVFAMMPAGLAAVAASDMTLRIPAAVRNIAGRLRAANRIATKGGFARTNGSLGAGALAKATLG